ncbi:MAG: hypothetical protein ACQGVK_07205 [Myxococcota bacterium]
MRQQGQQGQQGQRKANGAARRSAAGSGRARGLSAVALPVLAIGLMGHACPIVEPPARGESPMRAAACSEVITPVVGENHSDPIYMAGFGNDRQATGVHDELSARGIVIESEGTKVALVTLDLVGYFNNEVQTIRSLVDPARGFDAIVVSSTHNHEGPDTMGLWGPDELTSGVDQGYLDFVNDSVVACIEAADDALAPAAIRFATGTTEGASLEPWPGLVADGKVLQELVIDLTSFGEGILYKEGDPGPILNTSVPTLQLAHYRSLRERAREVWHWLFHPWESFPDLRPLGDVIATVVNFASHPESLGSDNTLLTADFPHAMREALEDVFGGVAIYVSADLGVLQGPLDVDLDDPETGDPIPRRTFEFADEMGRRLAERAASALTANLRWSAAPAIDVAASGPFFLEVENPYFQAFGTLGLFGRRAIETQDGLLGITTEVQVLRIGDATLVVTPNELDPQIGDLYRERIGEASAHRFTIGLGNDELGYQMPEAKFNPSCFKCFLEVLAGMEERCVLADTLDCGTTMQNNIGPGADPVFQEKIATLIDQVHP